MKSGLRFDVLVKDSESALKDLGYAFFKNGSGTVIEFEIQMPEKFIVRLEKLEDRVLMNPMLGRGFSRSRAGPTNVSILLGENRPESEKHAALFVSRLLAILPANPWKGLGFVESLTAKSLWREWTVE